MIHAETLAALEQALAQAVLEAEKYRGATSPNPPVGACGLDVHGRILGVAAHHRAGEHHAERLLIEELQAQNRLDSLHTLVVTLEPCNHQGRTPPCTDAIFSSLVKRVAFAVRDPNPKAAGGSARLQNAGIEVICLSEVAPASSATQAAQRQLGPFLKVVRSAMPWITVKQALAANGSMIPPPGMRTFTSPASLQLAHELRRRSDAILTGSGTVLSDHPEFTVRHVPDHAEKRRFLVIADRSGRIQRECPEYLKQAQERGFQVLLTDDWVETLRGLASKGVMEVLVEAGPLLTHEVLQSGLWDEHWTIRKQSSGADRVERQFRSILETS